jgi:hypothetical protein
MSLSAHIAQQPLGELPGQFRVSSRLSTYKQKHRGGYNDQKQADRGDYRRLSHDRSM